MTDSTNLKCWHTGAARWWLGSTAAFLALSAFLWTCFSGVKDALIVDGLPFREWLLQTRVEFPLAKLGTNALPHLVAILRGRSEPAWRLRLKQRIWPHIPNQIQRRVTFLRPIPDEQLRRTALLGVRLLGPEAAAALPDVLRIGTMQTNLGMRAGALIAALNIAPQSPDTFALWRNEWMLTNHFSHQDLALYLGMPGVPISNAVPYLLSELTNENSPAIRQVANTLGFFGSAAVPALPQMIRLFEGAAGTRSELLLAFQRLGPLASNAVPTLKACLLEQGPATIQVFDGMQGTQIQVDQRPDWVAGALRALSAIGPNAHSALPAIDRFLTDSDPSIRMIAAAAHIRAGGSVQEAMPILIAGLQNKLTGTAKVSLRTDLRMATMPELIEVAARGREAAEILCGELGAIATNALPYLHPLRITAAQAIWRISHDSNRVLPVLVAVLDSASRAGSSDDHTLVRAIEAVGEIGPEAVTAIPSLERARTLSMSARRAVSRALANIRRTQ